MLRFDLLNRYRSSILKIFKVFKNNPKNFIVLIFPFIESIEMMAKLSNIETKGIVGNIKLKGLLVIYFSTFLTWIKDENPTLDKTMSVLDNYLEKAENVLKLLRKKNG
jgi:hypothetical protein